MVTIVAAMATIAEPMSVLDRPPFLPRTSLTGGYQCEVGVIEVISWAMVAIAAAMATTAEPMSFLDRLPPARRELY